MNAKRSAGCTILLQNGPAFNEARPSEPRRVRPPRPVGRIAVGPRLLLVETRALVAEALGRLLATDYEVAISVTDGAELARQVREIDPDLVLVGVPPTLALGAVLRLCRQVPSARVVVLSSSPDPQAAADAFGAGAAGYVLMSASGLELARALRDVRAGRRYLPASIAGGDPGQLPPSRHNPCASGRLSSRTREVVRLLAAGHSMKQAAAALGITARTVAYHKYGAMRRLAVTSSAALVRFAVEDGLLHSASAGQETTIT